MSPKKPKRPALREAARLTQELMDTGMTKKDVADAIGRNPSLVSQFFTKGKGESMTDALRAVRDRVQAGERDPEALRAAAAPHMSRRKTKSGSAARVRGREVVTTPRGSSRARAARQHLASGGARLRPVVEGTAAAGGRVAFSVRAPQSAWPKPEDDEYPQGRGTEHKDGSRERTFGNAGQGYSASEWAERVQASGGDVSAAVHEWMREAGYLKAEGQISHLEIRGWVPRGGGEQQQPPVS